MICAHDCPNAVEFGRRKHGNDNGESPQGKLRTPGNSSPRTDAAMVRTGKTGSGGCSRTDGRVRAGGLRDETNIGVESRAVEFNARRSAEGRTVGHLTGWEHAPEQSGKAVSGWTQESGYRIPPARTCTQKFPKDFRPTTPDDAPPSSVTERHPVECSKANVLCLDGLMTRWITPAYVLSQSQQSLKRALLYQLSYAPHRLSIISDSHRTRTARRQPTS